MDLTLKTAGGVFNYRVCAVIKHNNRLLAMKNNLSPYYFLPCGRVDLHEAVEEPFPSEDALKKRKGLRREFIKPHF